MQHALCTAAFIGILATTGSSAQENWETVSLPGAEEATLEKIDFISDDVGYIRGFEGDGFSSYIPYVFRTTDGGQTWSATNIDETGITHFSFLDEATGIGYGRDNDCSCSMIGRSTDGGATWEMEDYEQISYVSSLHSIDGTTAYLVGSNQDFSASIALITTDGGMTWTEHGEAPAGLVVSQIFSSDVWYGRVGSSLATTTDGGLTWTTSTVSGMQGIGRIREVLFLSEDLGFLATGNNGPYPEIFRSTDGGESWTSVYRGQGYPYEMDNVAFVTEDVGFAMAGDGTVVQSEDRGMSWEDAEIGRIIDLTRQGGTVWAVGLDGTLLRRSASEFAAAVPVIGSDLETIDFGQTLVGDRKEMTVEIRNDGGAELEITEIVLSGGAGDLAITESPNLPLSFPEGLSIRVTVEYTPSSVGDLNATLEVSSNDPATPLLELPVTGRGTDEITSVADRARHTGIEMKVTPNPIGESGTLQLTLEHPLAGELSLYDVRGERVATLHAGPLSAGKHTLGLDNLMLPSGEYRCVLADQDRTYTVCTVRR